MKIPDFTYRMAKSCFILCGTLVLLSGCASYQPQPLPDNAGPLQSLEMLSAEINKNKARDSLYDINLADGLNLTEVAILAVLGDPDLRAARAQLNIAGAQAFSAGLLPDPQLSFNFDKPTGNAAGLVNGFGAGFTYDIVPLITRQARMDAGRATRKKVRLDILWQEWQVIQQARTLAVRFRLEQEKLALLEGTSDLYKQRYRRSAQGVKEGTVTLGTNGTDLSALMDSMSRIYHLDQAHNRTRHALNLLLGLPPDADIKISKLSPDTRYQKSTLQSRLDHLADIRPDLLALKAGYQAQENRVRAAILAQFPAFGIGYSTARDTGDVRSNGISIGLTIPLFSGNRGAIAIERATRAKLYQEYKARLAQAGVEVDRLFDLQDIVTRQQKHLAVYLPKLQAVVTRARRAYARGDIDALTFLNMETTWINKRLERIDIRQSQWEIRTALQTLLALPEDSLASGQIPDLKENSHDD